MIFRLFPGARLFRFGLRLPLGLLCLLLVSGIVPANSTETGSPELSPDKLEILKAEAGKRLFIRSHGDAVQVRARVVSALWGKSVIPKVPPPHVVCRLQDPRFEDIHGLESMDELVVRMDFGIESRVRHFRPRIPSGRLVLYHQGHDGDYDQGKEMIRALLDKGFDVAAFAMPLIGPNNQPVVNLPGRGPLKLKTHDDLKFLKGKSGHPVRFFIEPIISALNYLLSHDRFRDVSMIGISGGGWTTTLAAALDTRIRMSFPVAGTYPLFLRKYVPQDMGDYEQSTPDLYDGVDYLDLYVLGSYGKGRKQLQILNRYDTCCFAGNRWEAYRNLVRERVREMAAGEFDVFLDESHRQHIISTAARTRILDELERIGGARRRIGQDKTGNRERTRNRCASGE